MTGKPRARSIALAVAVTTAIPLVGAVPSWAAPLTGSGTGEVMGNVVTSVREAGGNRIVERDITGVLTGSLEGTFTEHVTGVVHPDGTVTFGGTLTLTGEVDGCGTGTVVGRLEGRGQAAVQVTDAIATVLGLPESTIEVSGHGNVHQEGPALTYTVEYTCR